MPEVGCLEMCACSWPLECHPCLWVCLAGPEAANDGSKAQVMMADLALDSVVPAVAGAARPVVELNLLQEWRASPRYSDVTDWTARLSVADLT